MPPGPRSPTAPASVRATQSTCISTLTVNGADRIRNRRVPRFECNDESTMRPDPNKQGDLTMRLSDAGLHRRQTKALYPNHRLPPWLTEDATRDRSNRLLEDAARRIQAIAGTATMSLIWSVMKNTG